MNEPQRTRLRPCIGRCCKIFTILLLIGGCSLLSASVKKIPDGFLSIKPGSEVVQKGVFMELPWEGFNRYNIPMQSDVKIPTITSFDGSLQRLKSLKVNHDCRVKYRITDVKRFVRYLTANKLDVSEFTKGLTLLYTRAVENGKTIDTMFPFLRLGRLTCKKKPTLFRFRQRPDCEPNKTTYKVNNITDNDNVVVPTNNVMVV